MTSFFVSDDSWNRLTEITLLQMDRKIPSMEKAKINDFVNIKNDKLLYLFDFFSDRFFRVELVNIIDKISKQLLPKCINTSGDAPKQIVIDADLNSLLDDDITTEYNYNDENVDFENIDDLDI